MTKFSFIKKVKLNTKFPLIRQIALLIAILMLLVMAALAWFASKETAEADGLNISMSSGKNLLISLDGENFVTSIDLLSDEAQDIIGSQNKIKGFLNMTDITSDGVTFLRPTFKEIDGERIPNVEDDWKVMGDEDRNNSFISQTVTFRTDSPSIIYLSSGTGISTYSEENNQPLTGSNSGNKSEDGDFSKDCIVGALRISAVDSSGNLCFLCIPRSDIVSSVETNENDEKEYSVVIDENGSPDSMIHSYYSTNYAEEKEEQTASGVIYSFDGTQQIAVTTKNSEFGYYEATATINIWLEGCDAETRRAFSGGKFNMSFDFTAVETNEPEATDTTEDPNYSLED